MAHEVAKLMLEHAATFLQRTEALEAALRLGMPLAEIEEYLDWLDATGRGAPAPADESKNTPGDSA
jgi:DNA-binding transcriptional MerR regulator